MGRGIGQAAESARPPDVTRPRNPDPWGDRHSSGIPALAQVALGREEPTLLACRCNRFGGHLENSLVWRLAQQPANAQRNAPPRGLEITVFTIQR